MNDVQYERIKYSLPVSICVPTFNGASYLRECLDSVLVQTFLDFEVLIVDDQSTDESCDIALEYASLDSRIRLVRNEHNLGLVENWNQCALLAHGEWIKFLFQDDILEANCLERMLAVSSTNTSMVVCKRKIIFEDESECSQKAFLQLVDKNNMDRIFGGEKEITPENFSKAVLDNWLQNFIGEPTAVLLHRSVFSRFGFFNPHLIQICDLEYWIRVASHSGLIYIPEFLAGFRRHSKGTTNYNKNSRKFRMHIDELVCNHELVFHPLYKPLRFYALQRQSPTKLNQVFALKVKNAYKIARQASKNNFDPDPKFLEDLNDISLYFPGFRAVHKMPFSLRSENYRWKIKKCLTKILFGL